MYTYLEILASEEQNSTLSAAVIRQKREVRGQAYNLVDVFDFKGEKEEDNLCLICLCEPPDCIILPCRHMVVNIDCAKLIDEKKDKFECPLCRTEAEELIYVNLHSNKVKSKDDLKHTSEIIITQKSMKINEIRVSPEEET